MKFMQMHDQSTNPRRYRFDTELFPEAERLSAARGFFDGVCDLQRVGAPTAPFLVRGNSWRIGDFFANHTVHGPFHLTYTKTFLMKNFRILRYIARGSFTNIFDGNASSFNSQQIVSGHSVDGMSAGGFEYYCLRAPLDLIENDLVSDNRFRSIDMRSQRGQTAHHIMMDIFSKLYCGKADHDIKERIEGLFYLLAADSPKPAEASRPFLLEARAEAMRRYVDTHLADETLDAARLASVFGTSRATVYRAFADEGGVAQAIANRRMVRAFRVLAAAEPRRGLVKAIGEASGYADQAHFSRLFRRQFGISPRDIMGLTRADAAEAQATARHRSGAGLSSLYH